MFIRNITFEEAKPIMLKNLRHFMISKGYFNTDGEGALHNPNITFVYHHSDGDLHRAILLSNSKYGSYFEVVFDLNRGTLTIAEFRMVNDEFIYVEREDI